MGAIEGGIYGGIGGLMGGGGWKGVLIGAGTGAFVGGVAGTFDPSLGLLTATSIGGVTSGLGDYLSQRLSGAGGPCHPISWGEVGGAAVGGLLGGGVGGYVGAGVEATGGADWASALASNTVGGSFGLSTTGVGMALGARSLAGRNCGCQ